MGSVVSLCLPWHKDYARHDRVRYIAQGKGNWKILGVFKMQRNCPYKRLNICQNFAYKSKSASPKPPLLEGITVKKPTQLENIIEADWPTSRKFETIDKVEVSRIFVRNAQLWAKCRTGRDH